MIKKIYILTLLLCAYFASNASSPIGNTLIISQEVNPLNGQLAVKMRVFANRSLYYTNVQTKLPTGWSMGTITFPAQSYISGNTYADFIVNITYPTSSLPFYPVSISITLDATEQNTGGVTTLIAPPTLSEKMTAKGKIYFTPYNSVELWDEGDFNDLKRTWFVKGAPIDTTRIFVPQSSIPQSNITSNDSVKLDWQDDLQLKFVKGLAYAVQMKGVDPAVITAQNDDDGVDSSYNVAQARIGRTFSGTIRGRLVTTIQNDLGQPVTFGLAGILVKLKEDDRLFNEEFAEVTTDANGNFTINYSKSQSFLEGNHIELFLKIKSKNRQYDIKSSHHQVFGSSYETTVNVGQQVKV